MPDTLTLGGISFDGFSTPHAMGAGGKQAMVVHKLPGGRRVIDTLGPDEDNITWSGELPAHSSTDRFSCAASASIPGTRSRTNRRGLGAR